MNSETLRWHTGSTTLPNGSARTASGIRSLVDKDSASERNSSQTGKHFNPENLFQESTNFTFASVNAELSFIRDVHHVNSMAVSISRLNPTKV